MISKEEAQALFDELAGIVRRGDELVLEIIEKQAWIPLGYDTLVEAWAALIGDYHVGSKAARLEVAIQIAKDSDPQWYGAGARFHEADVRGIAWGSVCEVRDLLLAGVDEDAMRDKIAKRSGTIHSFADGRFMSALRGGHQRTIEEYAQREYLDSPGQWANPENHRAYLETARKYRRRGGEVSYPERPYRITVEFTNAEVERFKRIAEAKGSTVTTEAKKAIERRFDALESDLSISV